MPMQWVLGLVLVLAIVASDAKAADYHYVANTRPPDAFLRLRTQPSASSGQRITTMPNGTVLQVLERRSDGWWLVRIVATGQEGWALSGTRFANWIECCVSPGRSSPNMQLVGFRSPSNNIHCMIDATPGSAPYLRCDIYQIETSPPPKPVGCDGDWGQAFGIASDGTLGERLCYSDAVLNDNWPVLHYGREWTGYGFRCKSETTGITCTNSTRHGFSLARKQQIIF